MQLNEEQKAAVEHPLDQPACLIAGAGSGKTRVLTERVRWLMDNGVPAKRICGITFTNKAAGELIHRLGLDETTDFEIPRVSTIHSLALRGIRKDPQAFGLKDKVTPLDEWDQKQMVKKIVERGKSKDDDSDSWGIVKRVLEKIGFHRARGIGFSNEYTDALHEKALLAHGGYHALDDDEVDLWAKFEEEKKENSVVDFDDMLHLVVRRMRTDPRWLKVLQKQFDHVLMDEAQDTNPVQWEFVNGLLRPDNMNLYVVGDMSQSIFGFSGAVPELLKQFSEEWRGVTPLLYRIARNHRSVPEVVDFANLIQNKMTRTIPLKMESWRGTQKHTGEVRKITLAFPQSIAAQIATEIKRDSRTTPFKENAILVRTSMQIRDLEAELVKRRVPYVIRGGLGLLATEEVRDLLAYLRLAANHKDFTALVRAASAPRCGVGEATLEKVRQHANAEFGGDLIEAGRQIGKLSILCDVIEHASMFREAPITALDKVLTMTGYKEYVRQKYQKEQSKVTAKLENIERFGTLVIMLSSGENYTLDDLIFQLSIDRPKADDQEQKEAILVAYNEGKISEYERDAKLKVIEQGSVTITTIHSAKGLEWSRVYVTNLFEDSLPHWRSKTNEDEVEEERRLFYVACTRARDYLVWCVPEKQLSPDGKKVAKLVPSRFLTEIGA